MCSIRIMQNKVVHRVFNSAQYLLVNVHHVVNGGQYVNQMVNHVDYSAHIVNTATREYPNKDLAALISAIHDEYQTQ